MLLKHLALLWRPALCALALLLVSFTAHAQPGKARDLVGTVVDIDGKPVANATVMVAGGPSTTTAGDGGFKLAGVATSSVLLDITAEGFTEKQLPVLGGTTTLQLQVVIVKRAPAAPPSVEARVIGGVVLDAARAPVAGATVRVHGTQLRGVTGADGSFSLPGVPVDEVTLDIEAANQPAVSTTVPANKAAVLVTLGAPGAAPPAPTTRAIHGKVIDKATGQPLAGAQVEIVGLAGATQFTDADGTFAFENVPAAVVKLDVTAPEHESHVLDVLPGEDALSIPLGQAEGEQIVIEGRAPAFAKESVVSGGSVIEGKDLTRVSAATLDDAMVAKLPGANLQSNTGAPGGGAQLRLRGISTINGQSSPLYVIDGIVISNISTSSGANAITAAANNGGIPSNQDNPVNRISDLNPNDIENIEVLKGASAAALYGSKAANGVVVITTKRGRQGENHASVTQRIGMAQPGKRYGSRHWNSVDEVRSEFCAKPEATECDSNPYVMAYNAAGGRTWDHEAEITRSPIMTETLASASGGLENGNYYGSVLIADEPGILIGTYYKKQTGKLSIGYKFGDRVKLGLTANVIHSESDRGISNNDNTATSPYFILSALPNFIDVQPKDGVYPGNVVPAFSSNPLENVNMITNKEEVTRLITGGSAAVNAFSTPDGQHRVTALGNVGVDAFTQKNMIVSPSTLAFEPDDGLLGTRVDGTTTNMNFNAGASISWAFSPLGRAFRNNLTAGLTYESVDTRTDFVIARNLTGGQPNIDTGTAVRTQENLVSTKEAGGYAQDEIALLDERLTLIGGLLAERSSLNGDVNKYHFYPKIGGAYAIIKPGKTAEPPLLAAFEALRVRANYGETGNRPNYGNKFTALTAINNIASNGGVYLNNTSVGDSKIEPERQREIELGVDAATQDQRVVAELTGYQRSISNMLLQRTLATSTGFNTQFLNGGSMRNRGLEAAVAVKPVKTSLIEWTSRGALTLNRSKITDLPVPAFNTGPNFGGFGAYRIEKGKSATQIVGVIDGKTAQVGDGEPDFRIGWSNVLRASDFTISALIDWQHGSDIMNLTTSNYDSNHNAPDPAAAARRLALFNDGNTRAYIEDGSFVKIREISIAYELPRRLISGLGPLRSLQLSLSGRNLYTFTSYTGLDPEVSNFGAQSIARNIDVTPYPPSRTFWLSVTAGI